MLDNPLCISRIILARKNCHNLLFRHSAVSSLDSEMSRCWKIAHFAREFWGFISLCLHRILNIQKATVCECQMIRNTLQWSQIGFPKRPTLSYEGARVLQVLYKSLPSFFKVLPMQVNRYTTYFTTMHGMNSVAVAEQHSGSVIFLHSRIYPWVMREVLWEWFKINMKLKYDKE